MTALDPVATVGAVFDRAIAAEQGAARLYRHFAQLFASVADVAALWQDLAQDEHEHAQTLAAIRAALGEPQLAEPPDRALWDSVLEIGRMLSQDLAQPVRTLDDAYEQAHELESSEVNAVFKFLAARFVTQAGKERLLDMQIARHQEKLTAFAVRHGDRAWRRGVRAQGTSPRRGEE